MIELVGYYLPKDRTQIVLQTGHGTPISYLSTSLSIFSFLFIPSKKPPKTPLNDQEVASPTSNLERNYFPNQQS